MWHASRTLFLCFPSLSSALGTGRLTGHLHQWDKGKKGEPETQHMLFAFPIVRCLAGKFVLSHYDTENERGSITPQDGVRTARNNILNVDIMGWWQLDCIEASQIIHLTSTSKTIEAMIKTDVKKKKKNTCRNMFGIKKGNVEKLHTEFFCSSLHLSF